MAAVTAWGVLTLPAWIDAVVEPAAAPVRITVAARRLTPGTRVTTRDITTMAWQPPPGLALVDDPVGRVVSQVVLAGEPLLAARLAPAGVDGVPALVPPGQRAVAIPIAVTAPPLRVGDVVDVHTTDGTGAALTVAEAAVVVAVTADAVTITVDEDHIPMLAAGLASGATILALQGPGG